MPVNPVNVEEDILERYGDSPQKRRVLLDQVNKMAEEDKKRQLDIIQSQEIRAKYKIEIMFGKDRSISALKPSTGIITIWESGRRFHGGGDQKMYWCGYDDCKKPIMESNFAHFHTVCPSCSREQFLDPGSKKKHIDYLQKENRPTKEMSMMPCIVGERLFKLPPQKIADLLEKLWWELGGSADIYLKYHPTDIRYDMKHESTKTIDLLNKAREERRTPTIYPLKNIIKDTSAGASLNKRFFALVTA